MPFVLGQPFTLTVTARAASRGNDAIQATGSTNTPFTLSFFEADGVTPVAFEVPEATSLVLGLIGALGVFGVTRRYSSVQQSVRR